LGEGGATGEEHHGLPDRDSLEYRRLALALASAYICPMSWFPKPVGPRAAFADLRAFMRQRSREQVIGATLAILVTTIIVIEFVVDSKINTAPPQQIVYAESWKADRADAEIIAEQKVDQAKRDKAAKEKQRQFQKLEKQLGM
jgi:hypothetical protein